MTESARKNIVLIIILLASIAAAVGLGRKLATAPTIEQKAEQLLSEDKKAIGKIGQGFFNFEFARSIPERELGLSGRSKLAETDSMLFIFDSADKHCIWMKDMKFNIDILWFDDSKKLIYEKRNVSPDTYPEKFCPDKPANFVAEVTAGVAEKNQIKLGDILDVKL